MGLPRSNYEISKIYNHQQLSNSFLRNVPNYSPLTLFLRLGEGGRGELTDVVIDGCGFSQNFQACLFPFLLTCFKIKSRCYHTICAVLYDLIFDLLT